MYDWRTSSDNLLTCPQHGPAVALSTLLLVSPIALHTLLKGLQDTAVGLYKAREQMAHA